MSQKIVGGTYTDLRGKLRFCNDFDMSAVKRFYTISNSAEQPVRGWIGHKKETKWFFPLSGKTEIAVESFAAEEQSGVTAAQAGLANRASQAERERVPREAETFVLDASMPAVLKVPPCNWFKIVQDGNAEVMVFSDCYVGEFENDDFRKASVLGG